jgi:hypothetical protein
MDKPNPGLSEPVAASDLDIELDEATKRRAALGKVARDKVIMRKTIEKLGGHGHSRPETSAQTERKAHQARDEAMARYRARNRKGNR